jgi:hypothetical protein
MNKRAKLSLIAFSIFPYFMTLSPYQVQAQFLQTTNTTIPKQPDLFRVAVTLFGVKDDTGSILSFVKVDNLTAGRLFNASNENILKSNNGIVETSFPFPNQTIPVGATYEACVLVLKNANISCTTGYNSPGPKTEYEQIRIQ